MCGMHSPALLRTGAASKVVEPHCCLLPLPPRLCRPSSSHGQTVSALSEQAALWCIAAHCIAAQSQVCAAEACLASGCGQLLMAGQMMKLVHFAHSQGLF